LCGVDILHHVREDCLLVVDAVLRRLGLLVVDLRHEPLGEYFLIVNDGFLDFIQNFRLVQNARGNLILYQGLDLLRAQDLIFVCRLLTWGIDLRPRRFLGQNRSNWLEATRGSQLHRKLAGIQSTQPLHDVPSFGPQSLLGLLGLLGRGVANILRRLLLGHIHEIQVGILWHFEPVGPLLSLFLFLVAELVARGVTRQRRNVGDFDLLPILTDSPCSPLLSCFSFLLLSPDVALNTRHK
jgi:hypothetical protein